MQNFLKRKLGLHKLDAKSIALLGIFTALTFVFTACATLRIGNQIEISLKFVPVFVLGALFGPVYAGIASFLADVLSVAMFPAGAPLIGMFVTEFLSGFFYGMFFYNRYRMNVSYIIRLVFCVILQLFLSLVLNSYILCSAGYFSSMYSAMAIRAAASFGKMFLQIAVIAFAPYYLRAFSRIAKH